ncbi:ku p70 DNA helicase, putative [Ichthyophthirius multifiliis]|uniref:Ku p70 DNA helicase, putative n=1 Tax=Ichthyophthirius multifiliis TaxID=5932 RepID=G0QTZ1_ICHMU|nr:ku p70 DNA helicase, putative [Ichthyophthirius multifiliis]EGR31314.1 ku p70 DNA helicase, putative [Ichthyophthirius multifiliis]|eukprot:XP_004034800.1 ku p70 DNA helicase, putative [Ichthyophthirius multifiliis]
MEFDDDNIENEEQELGDDFDALYIDEDDAAVPDLLSKKDCVIFAVDCNPQIFQKQEGNPNNESQFNTVLKSIQSFFKSKIILNVDDKVSLIFYNVDKTSNLLSFNGINTVYPLESPSAQMIKDVLKLDQNFEQQFGFRNQKVKLYEVLWLCNHMFQSKDRKRNTMRIFLFTNDDNPPPLQERQQCIHQAKLLAEMDAQIELFPLPNAHQKFDLRKFYTEIIALDVDEINESLIDSSEKILDLQNRLRQKEYKKRPINRLLLYIGKDSIVGTKVYCPYIKVRKPFPKYIDQASNKLLKKTTKNICSETGQILYPNQISQCIILGGEKVRISSKDVQKMKHFQEPSMTLIGFKPLSQLKVYHNYRPSYFVYPDDFQVKGSSQFFHALITQMKAKNKIAIVRFQPKRGSQVRFCALLPQEEAYDEDHVQQPPGFYLISLPYSDDMRDLTKVVQHEEKVEVNNNLINCAKMICNALEIHNFDVRNFEDPGLQKFYAHLQAHALNEISPEETQDLITPDEEGMKKYEEILNLFQEAINLDLKQQFGG